MRVRERSGFPVRKKCSNQVRRSCFHAFTRATTPVACVAVAAAEAGAAVGAADGTPGIETGMPGIPMEGGAAAEPTTAGRGVKSTFMNGEIIPIVAPLDRAKPKMRSDVTMSRKR